ncbi:siderophore-interacting protein [Dasania marina]|uniref:siderophore-interacting protein n=1 Tax=Dasania marina TaxID=471499 RepID=UPI001969C224|nr:siderophore-interacting protein [Dasania marina]
MLQPCLAIAYRQIAKHQQLPTVKNFCKRIILGGSALKGFPTNQDGAYIKLLLPDNHQHSAATRTYTVRNYREAINELDVDFVLHGDGGPASAWAGR